MEYTSDEPRLRICVADDDADSRDLLRRLVETLGHQAVCVVEDGRSLIAATADQEIDLILLDLDMPDIDGLTAAEELSKRKRFPIIMLSGHSDLNYVVREQEPIAAWLTKPITLDALNSAIRALF